MKKYFLLFIIAFTTSCANLPQFDRHILDDVDYEPEPLQNEVPENDSLIITIFDVGQGDAILLRAPTGETMLIDGGPPESGSNIIRPFLGSNRIYDLTYILATHYHADHIGGLIEIAGSGTEILDRGNAHAYDNELYSAYEASASEKRTTVKAGDSFSLGDADIEIVAVDGAMSDGTAVDTKLDENAASIALVIEYFGFRMFVGGDITNGENNSPDIETPLALLVGDIDVLKVSHHGSDTSTNEVFLDATLPEIAVISVGDYNNHGHPHSPVIERLINHGIDIYQTEKGLLESDIPIVADGNITIQVDNEGEYGVEY